MKTRLLLAIASCAMLFASCAGNSDTYTINVTVPDNSLDGKTLYITNRDYNISKTDSAVVKGSTLTFTGKADTAAFCQIHAGQYYVNFILENGTINLNLGESTKPSGTALNDEFARFMAAEDSLNNIAMLKQKELFENPENKEEDKEKLNQQWLDFLNNEWKPAYLGTMERFFMNNLDNPVGIRAAYSLGNYTDSPQLAKEKYMMLSEQIRNTPFVQSLIQVIEAADNTAVGKMFTDFSIETEDGNNVSFSDYVGKGKYTLVDFWASWCGPCREETPVIAEVYNKYKNKGLEVLGVAVWDSPADTKKAIEELQITWPQIINAGEVPTDLYGIDGIPHIILFGPDGTIVARDLRGDRLKAAVKEAIEGTLKK